MDNTLEAVFNRSNQQAMVMSDGGGGGGEYGLGLWDASKQSGGDVEELLAHAGYNVRASDLSRVAQRMEVLDSIMGAAPEGVVGAAADTVHYNPSDIASWIELMLEEMQQQPPSLELLQLQQQQQQQQQPQQQQQQQNHEGGRTDSLESAVTNTGDFHAAAGFVDSYGELPSYYPMDLKQQQVVATAVATPRPSSSSSSCVVQQNKQTVIQQAPPPPAPPSTSEECGVRLVHLLLGCADAVQRGDSSAEEMLSQLRAMVDGAPGSSSGAMGRVAAHFAEGLRQRIYRDGGGSGSSGGGSPVAAAVMLHQICGSSSDGAAMDELLHFNFYEMCPYLKFAHFTANQAILEAFEGHKQVHVVDFNLQYGLQWPALIQALALRPGGPPLLRLTGIGPPQPGGNDLLRDIGLKLHHLAESVNVEFVFQGLVANRLDEVEPWKLTVRRDEAVAVNSVFQLHRILDDAEGQQQQERGGGRATPVEEVLRWVRALRPRIVTLVEQDADHNGAVFMERFMSSLHYYSTMFDSLEACNLKAGSLEQVEAEAYLGREVVDIVAAEGRERAERHETLGQWRERMVRAGFKPLFLGSNAFKQANMLLTLFSGDGYRVEENAGCLTLGWHSRSLVAASAWQCC